MNAIWQVFRYEILRNGRRRGYLFTTFGFPIVAFLFLLVMQNINAGSAPEPEAAAEAITEFADFEGIEQAAYIDQSGLFTDVPEEPNLIRYTDLEAARADLIADAVDAVYVIDPDFADTGKVTLMVREVSLNGITTAPVYHLIYTEIGELITDQRILARMQDPVNLNTINLQREGTEQNEDTSFVLVYGFAILFAITVFGTSGYLMQSVIEEKENRLVEILITSIRPGQLLTGKILALGTLGLFQLIAWIGISYLLVNSQANGAALIPFLATLRIPTEPLPILAIYFVLGYLMFSAVFGGIGAISNSISEGPQLSVIFVLPSMVPFYLFPMFISQPDGTLPVLFSLFPLTAPLSMTMRLVSAPVPGWQIVISVILLALTTIALFWAAGRLFRVQSLLAGKVPKLRDLPRLVFEKA
ncbi:MAG: ABC transporter permease [Anaerolineae bacterium]|jgi:ABC-2 type transport system permease protein|nr:ABC transporter permease [Anaerolineae bacterium]